MKQYEDTPLQLDLLEAADFGQWPSGRLTHVVEQAAVRQSAFGNDPDYPKGRWLKVQRRAVEELERRDNHQTN
jgi:hypothetical protein